MTDAQPEINSTVVDEPIDTVVEVVPKAAGKGKRARKPKVTACETDCGCSAETTTEDPAGEACAPVKPAIKKNSKGKRSSAKSKAAKLHTDALVAKALAEAPVGDVSVTRVLYIEENAPTSDSQPQIKTVNRVQKRRKQLDVAQTQAKYRERMVLERSPEDWASLNGAWLSDYKLYTNEPKLDHSAHHGHIIIELAKDRGSIVKGLCAENVKKCEVTSADGLVVKERKFVQDPLPDGTPRAAANIVYIGNKNMFTEHDQSIWSCKPDETWILPQ